MHTHPNTWLHACECERAHIHNHPELNWTIGYLTYTAEDARGQEISAFWQRRGIPCVFLGYVDDYRDLETKKISFDTGLACKDLQALADQHDLVTHTIAAATMVTCIMCLCMTVCSSIHTW